MNVKFIFLLILLAMFAYPAEGAKISGKVYDYKITPLNEVIVFVDTEPVQRYIVNDGTYFFELPIGTYTIIARTFNDSKNVLGTNENVVIKDNGSFIFDLVLYPVEPGDTTIITKGPDDEKKGVFDPFKYKYFLDNQNGKWVFFVLIGAGAAAFALIIFLIYLKLKHNSTKKDDNKSTNGKKEDKQDRENKEDLEEASKKAEIKTPESETDKKTIDAENVISENKENKYIDGNNTKDRSGTDASSNESLLQINIGDNLSKISDASVNVEIANVVMENTNGKEITLTSVSSSKAEEKTEAEKGYIPTDETAKAVLGIIKREKRITQKEIRKQLPDSEAKISLVITELESKEVIKKIKKGRGNIIIYNE
jgi:uncharacterized membrane protein